MRRYETRSTIMTSNRPLEDWGKLIGDIPSATAILDRFLHHAELISITGRSYRLQRPGISIQAEDAVPGEPPLSQPEPSKPAKAPSGSGKSKTQQTSQNPSN
jgi:hypothetical protein